MTAKSTRTVFSIVRAVIELCWHGSRLAVALSFCLLALSPFVDPPSIEVGLQVPASLHLDATTYPVIESPPGVEHVHLEDVRGSLLFSPRSRTVVAGVAVIFIALFAALFWVLTQLRAVFHSLRTGAPFVAANATRIRRVGYAVIASAIVSAAVDYAGMRYASTAFAIEGVRLDAHPDLSLTTIFCGLIILVIAEVFREGTRLDEEQSLTV